MTERRLGFAPRFLDEQIERATTLLVDEIHAVTREFCDPARFAMLRAVPNWRKVDIQPLSVESYPQSSMVRTTVPRRDSRPPSDITVSIASENGRFL